MNKYLKYGILVLTLVVAFGLVASLQFESAKNKPLDLPVLKSPAPEFVLRNVQGKSVSLKDYQGKIVYIKFWASWCKDCIKEVIPQRILEQSVNDVAFINISVDKSEEAWKKAVFRNKLSAQELISINGNEQNINSDYNIDEIPRYVIINRKGEVVNNNAPHPGEIDFRYFAQYD